MGLVLKMRPGDQQLPIPNDNTCIQDMVIADIERRKAVGIERYGNALQAFNGRNALQDLYEELIDAAMYTRQLLEESKSPTVEVCRVQDEFPVPLPLTCNSNGPQSCNCD